MSALAKDPSPKTDGKRDEILASAARLFRHQGYAATTLREIADEAGIKAGSIYYHFDAKDEILGEVLDMSMKMVNDALRASMLRGIELPGLWPQLAVMIAWMVICFAVALRIFRWR